MINITRCETQDLYNTGTSDMNESQSWSLPSLNFLSADLTCWFNMAWCVHLIVSLESLPSQWRNTITTSTTDAFDFSIFWTYSIKATTNDCKCLYVNRIRSKNIQKKNVSEKQLACWLTWSMNLKLGPVEASLASSDKVIAISLRYEK